MEGQIPFTLYPLQKVTYEKLASSGMLETVKKAKRYISFPGVWRAEDKMNVAKVRAENLVMQTKKIIRAMYKQQLSMMKD